MTRKFLAVCLLAGLAVAAWYGARWFHDRRDLHVTIVVRSADSLAAGDPVTLEGETVGRVTKVTPLEGKVAVSVRIESGHRTDVLTDSLFSIESERGPRLEITNAVAIGTPVSEGAVIEAREDRLSRWLARHGREIGSTVGKLSSKARDVLRQYREGELSEEMRSFERKLPEWKSEGSRAAENHLRDLREKVEKLEKTLEEEGRQDEARRLKETFGRWVEDVRRKIAEAAPAD